MKSIVTCLVFFFITATLAYSSSYEEKSNPGYPAVHVSINNLNIFKNLINHKFNSDETAYYIICFQGNILEVLEENGLTTFLDLAIKTGVAETLLGPGTFPVFFKLFFYDLE